MYRVSQSTETLFIIVWKKQIELVPYHATKISKNTKTPFFPPNRKTCVFRVFFVCDWEMSQKKQREKEWFEDLSILNEYPSDCEHPE